MDAFVLDGAQCGGLIDIQTDRIIPWNVLFVCMDLFGEPKDCEVVKNWAVLCREIDCNRLDTTDNAKKRMLKILKKELNNDK